MSTPHDVAVTFTERELVTLSDILRRVGPGILVAEDGTRHPFSPDDLAYLMNYYTNGQYHGPDYRSALVKIEHAKMQAWQDEAGPGVTRMADHIHRSYNPPQPDEAA